uniref:Secreted protein n=1 Tax=Rhabditophanes sp. KR3021 TaxID=114890 RepID=A0AC35UDS5_9BILA
MQFIKTSIILLGLAVLAASQFFGNGFDNNGGFRQQEPDEPNTNLFFGGWGWGRRFQEHDITARQLMTLDLSADEKSTAALMKVVGEVIPRVLKLIGKLAPKDEDKRVFLEGELAHRIFTKNWEFHLNQEQLQGIVKELFIIVDKVVKAKINARIQLTGE